MREIDVLNQVFRKISEVAPNAAVSFVNQIASDASEYWQNMAEGASPWGSRYASTITFKPAKNENDVARVYSDASNENSKFVEFVENGIKSWSIKQALLNGKIAQRNYAKYGVKFVNVPFAHRTPRQSKTEKAGSDYSSILPEDIYQMAKAGQKITPEAAAKAGNKNLAGLKQYGEGVHSRFMTFRTVSENSKGWQYPSKAATPVFDKVQEMVNKHLSESMDSFIKAMIKLIQEEAK